MKCAPLFLCLTLEKNAFPFDVEISFGWVSLAEIVVASTQVRDYQAALKYAVRKVTKLEPVSIQFPGYKSRNLARHKIAVLGKEFEINFTRNETDFKKSWEILSIGSEIMRCHHPLIEPKISTSEVNGPGAVDHVPHRIFLGGIKFQMPIRHSVNFSFLRGCLSNTEGFYCSPAMITSVVMSEVILQIVSQDVHCLDRKFVIGIGCHSPKRDDARHLLGGALFGNVLHTFLQKFRNVFFLSTFYLPLRYPPAPGDRQECDGCKQCEEKGLEYPGGFAFIFAHEHCRNGSKNNHKCYRADDDRTFEERIRILSISLLFKKCCQPVPVHWRVPQRATIARIAANQNRFDSHFYRRAA